MSTQDDLSEPFKADLDDGILDALAQLQTTKRVAEQGGGTIALQFSPHCCTTLQ